jgi:hypothetical protein
MFPTSQHRLELDQHGDGRHNCLFCLPARPQAVFAKLPDRSGQPQPAHCYREHTAYCR